MGADLPDEELVRRFRRGSAEAFDAIVVRHRRALYGIAFRMLGGHHAADDVLQNALVKAWRALPRFRGESALRTWLVRIVVNTARSELSRRRPQDPLDGATEPADPAKPAERLIGERQTGRELRCAVAALPPRQREVVLLKVYSEMKHGEVAAALGITEGAAKAHLHQAVANLRRLLGEPKR